MGGSAADFWDKGNEKMKPTKKQNPFDVQIGQRYKARDTRRVGRFTVMSFEKNDTEILAVVAYSGQDKHVYAKKKINLQNFGRYELSPSRRGG